LRVASKPTVDPYAKYGAAWSSASTGPSVTSMSRPASTFEKAWNATSETSCTSTS
jgi:hypothetical protein